MESFTNLQIRCVCQMVYTNKPGYQMASWTKLQLHCICQMPYTTNFVIRWKLRPNLQLHCVCQMASQTPQRADMTKKTAKRCGSGIQTSRKTIRPRWRIV